MGEKRRRECIYWRALSKVMKEGGTNLEGTEDRGEGISICIEELGDPKAVERRNPKTRKYGIVARRVVGVECGRG